MNEILKVNSETLKSSDRNEKCSFENMMSDMIENMTIGFDDILRMAMQEGNNAD